MFEDIFCLRNESNTVLLNSKQYILLTMKCRLLQPLRNGGFSLLSG